VAAWLRSATWYLMENGEIIEDGQTMDGPGNIRWQAHREESGLCDPPRAVLSVLPQDGIKVPKNLFRQ
jgi:hypothetical protein